MKRIKFIILAFAALVLASSCKEKPNASFTYFSVTGKDTSWTPAVVNAGDKIYFRSTGTGTDFVVWPGDKLHDYSKKGEFTQDTASTLDTKNSGFSLHKVGASFESEGFSYTTKGEYNVAFIARTLSGSGYDEDVNTTVKIAVRDDFSTITNCMADKYIYLADTAKKNKKYIAISSPAKIDADTLSVELYYYYSNNDPYRVFFSLSSGTASVTFNGKPVGTTFYADIYPKKDGKLIYVVGDIQVISKEGTVKKSVLVLRYAKPSSDARITGLAIKKASWKTNGKATLIGNYIKLELPAGAKISKIDSIVLPFGASVKSGGTVTITSPPSSQSLVTVAQDGITTAIYTIDANGISFQDADIENSFSFLNYSYLPTEISVSVDTMSVIVTAGGLDFKTLIPQFAVKSFTSIYRLEKMKDKVTVNGVEKIIDSVHEYLIPTGGVVDFSSVSEQWFKARNGVASKYARVKILKK